MGKKIERIYTSANWNQPEDDFTQDFFMELKSNIWHPEEIPVTTDKNTWVEMQEKQQWAYAQNLQLLTYLDTYQGDLGMPVVARALPSRFHQRKAMLGMMGFEETSIHAKSYSSIFQTLIPEQEKDLITWSENNQALQELVGTIVTQYEKMDKFIFYRDSGVMDEDDLLYKVELWKTMVTSVFLESFLFYSGFYYPLYFYAQGKLMQSGEIINLIIRDELIHGIYVSKLAKELFEEFDASEKAFLTHWANERVVEIHELQKKVIDEIYTPIGMQEEVKAFSRYNANKAFDHLNFTRVFPEEYINPAVLTGLNTATKDFDFFSMKGNGYQRINIVPIENSDFYFAGVDRTALVA